MATSCIAFPPNFKGKGLHIFSLARAKRSGGRFCSLVFCAKEQRDTLSVYFSRGALSKSSEEHNISSVMGAKQSSQDDGRENLEALKEEIERLRKALSEEEEKK